MSATRWTVELSSGRLIEVGPEGVHDILTSDRERHAGARILPEYEEAYAAWLGEEPQPEPEPAPEAEPEPDEPTERDPKSLIEHLGGGWYSVEGLDENVRGREAALKAAEGL